MTLVHNPDDIFELRRRNLEKLIGEAGNVTKLAIRVGRSSSQLSQIRNRIAYKREGRPMFRQMGGQLARHIEKSMGLAMGWMDQDHEVRERAGMNFSDDAFQIASGLDAISNPELRRHAVAACMMVVFGAAGPEVAKMLETKMGGPLPASDELSGAQANAPEAPSAAGPGQAAREPGSESGIASPSRASNTSRDDGTAAREPSTSSRRLRK